MAQQKTKEKHSLHKEVNTKLALALLLAVVSVLSAFILLGNRLLRDLIDSTIALYLFPEEVVLTEEVADFKKFKSAEEFESYLEQGADLAGYGFWSGASLRNFATDGIGTAVGMPAPMAEEAKGDSQAVLPERISETNVQVLGIDEPDIVKTDGQNIYFSPSQYYYIRPMPMIEMDSAKGIMPPYYENNLKIIQAFPPADLKELSEIEKSGNLLLRDDILMVFSGQTIYGYDVSNKEKPKEEWKIELSQNNYLVGARLSGDDLYLITSAYLSGPSPCPFKPLEVNGQALEIKCVDIYHPGVVLPVDVTYTALKVDVHSGEAQKTVSFVGSSNSSVLYVSSGAIYLTYTYYGDFVKFIHSFLKEEAADLAPNWVLEKLDKLASYDISQSAKMTELSVILEQWRASLSDDERLKLENELTNRLEDYYEKHQRELEKTGLVKIKLADFKVAAVGNVPGRPLNQFSLDEYQGNLRVATTVGGRFWAGGFGVSGASANDVYVLSDKLEIIGSVIGLGLDEQIYSARFIEDKGYLVTFKQVDPFFVLDLSDPKNPQVKGELKIPGYSSYLHPIDKDTILGIGKEGSQVKLSLFDVSNPSNPKEKSKYTLDEYWSDVLNTHHAFLLDKDHQVFFMPGSRGGYIFDYSGESLKLESAVSNIQAKRAIYLDDYLYIIGDDKIVVLNELDWQRVNDLDF